MKNEAVVFIHGIWMKGIEFGYFAKNIKKLGYRTYHFRYSSLFKTPVENARQLNQYLKSINEPVIHLVAHSLGGIIVLHLFNRYELTKPGKIIMLGSPLNGSAVAKSIYQRPWLKWLLGKATKQALLGDVPAWSGDRDIHMIAGTKAIGMGQVLAHQAMQGQNDGTVNLEETKAAYIKQHIVVPQSHFSMLWSRQVLQKLIEILAGE